MPSTAALTGQHPADRLSTVLHLACIVVTAWGCLRYRRAPLASHAWWHTLLAALLVLVPLSSRVLPIAVSTALFGTEGVVEAVTEGILLAIVIAGVRERAFWMALPAAVLLGEELDWGFVLLPIQSPAPPEFLHSRSDTLNFHNSALFRWLWKPLPMLFAVLLCLRRWPPRLEALALRLRLPVLRRDGAWAIPLVVILFWSISRLLSHRFADESMELGLVSVVLCIWAKLPEPARAT